MYSDIGCQFSLKVVFPKDDLRDKNPQPKENSNDLGSSLLHGEAPGMGNSRMKNKFNILIQRKVRDLSEDRHQHDDFFEFIDQLKRKRNQSNLRGGGCGNDNNIKNTSDMNNNNNSINIISKNKNLVNMWSFI